MFGRCLEKCLGGFGDFVESCLLSCWKVSVMLSDGLGEVLVRFGGSFEEVSGRFGGSCWKPFGK